MRTVPFLMLAALALCQSLPASAQDRDDRLGTSGTDKAVPEVDPNRFGDVKDEAFGAYQRGYYLTALDLARPRAEAGDPAAQTLIAEIHARGLGVPRNADEAAKWYAKAAEQGVPEAQLQYGLMLLDGRFVEQDTERARTLLEAAAESDHPLAQFNYAQLLMREGSGPQGEEEAVEFYENAARAGLPDAQYAMAQIKANGVGGIEPDQVEARRWLERAAKRNYDTAQLDFGTWLVEGRGGEADPEEGFAWLKRAAEGGNVAARNRLAKLYRAGVGIEADPVEAAAWYILARRAGLVDREMESFMDGLTQDQTKQALERASRMR
ncbi:tetratricopeptide repeat protein [Nitratireductor luteus]|uniref:tetratricopeptide repeat protein n=1 Tax=Nitratireductor luteus TaxID=2976980 RepID=UPI002240C4CB|nr:tetratricopeptide repeat protein [Nitratireductor luteus]